MRNLSTITASDFGEELRRRRIDAGLSLRSLAQLVAFDYSYLAQVERGSRTGSVTLAHRCDHALDADGDLVLLFAERTLRQVMDEACGDD